MDNPSKSRYFDSVLWCCFGKSFPTTAINPVFTKLLAEIAAKVAAPPKTFFSVFLGVLIVSSAVEPKTVSICEEINLDV